ncbi:MAG: GMC family oxidoreductase N-terminal domain-containing protein [Pseudomonadota bacterium]|nr:GMC family oxidoreductase N-terminal domain-containing protein [Pseudomonadota bacterium]
MDSFDYVIVGAGSAGCVLANRLSADPSVTVCLLEAGPRDWHPMIHVPAGFMKTLTDPMVNWLYEAEPSEGTAGRVIKAPRGKTLGGSSSINGHIYNRGQSLDYDTWSQLGNTGWGYADVLPYFRRCERRVPGPLSTTDETYRGQDGEMVVSDIDFRHPLCEAFIEGAVSIGIPRNGDYNGRTQEGVSYAQRTIHKGRRMSTARAFLKPAMGRPNLTVRTGAHATRILLEEKRAVGVVYRKGGRRGAAREVRARREVLLSGGAVNSPQLLQVSGIGPGALLSQLGITPRHEAPGVGENLRDHYAPRFTARIKDMQTINELARGWRLYGQVAKWLTTGKGILSLSPTQVYGFWHSDEAQRSGDLQFTFTPASYHEGVQSQLDTEPGVTIAAWQQRPDSLGHVRARAADPFEKPEIQPNYLAAESDQRVFLAGMKLARRLLRTAPLAPYVAHEAYPGDHVQSDEELMAIGRARGTTTYHLMGTCRMGPDSDPTAVVDDQLRVKGLTGLRVIDASIMPTMLSANLNAGVMMIADKASDMILGKPAMAPIITARD